MTGYERWNEIHCLYPAFFIIKMYEKIGAPPFFLQFMGCDSIIIANFLWNK